MASTLFISAVGRSAKAIEPIKRALTVTSILIFIYFLLQFVTSNLTIPGSKFGIQIPGLATIRARAIVATAVTVEVGGQFWGALVKDGDYHKSSGPDPDLVWK
jgi:hypothetical protein